VGVGVKEEYTLEVTVPTRTVLAETIEKRREGWRKKPSHYTAVLDM